MADRSVALDRLPGVYRIVNTINGKSYIGSGVSLAKRRRDHWEELAKGTHKNKWLQHSWNKHGGSVFRFAVILVCSRGSLIFFEQVCIDMYNPEYNISRIAGSTLGVRPTTEMRAHLSAAHKGKKPSEETRRKMAAAHCGNKYNLGHSHTPETRAKMSAAHRRRHRERPVSAETRRKMGVAKAGNKYFLGHRHTPETRAKMSTAAKARRVMIT
jgi:group I intron endonuclease